MHTFGGAWTEQKLAAVKSYLTQYRRIFTENPKAKFYKTIYVDAFAGTGDRTQRKEDNHSLPLFDDEAETFLEGSAAIALSLDRPFDEYIFVELRDKYADQLDQMIHSDFPALVDRCGIHREEANKYLRSWCMEQNWAKHRAVVFLDPYGTKVEWSTLAAIAATKAIDLWFLFPIGMGANRLMTLSGNFGKGWEERLDSMFGTHDWKARFYHPPATDDMFGGNTLERIDEMGAIAEYFLERLRGIFAKVSPKPLWLYNSKGSPIFMLCFAAGNPRGADIAVRIANYILAK